MYIRYKEENSNSVLEYNLFHSYFGWGYIFRDSCYSCSKAGSARVSDIALADFWRIQKYLSEDEFSNMDAGTSMVMLNSEQGVKLFEAITHKVKSHQMDIMIACKENHNLERPSSVNQKRRKVIMNSYRLFGIAGVNKVYQLEKALLRLKDVIKMKR